MIVLAGVVVAVAVVISSLFSDFDFDTGSHEVVVPPPITVAMNAVRGRHRRRDRVRRKGHLVVVADSGPGAADRAAERIDLQRALGHLGERQRQVVALHYGLDLPIAEIAAQLGIAEGTVKATLHKSRRLLAAELEIADTDGSPS
jgi:RNA polymerase sigma-70 factor (ECF subfamily)